MTLKVIKGGYRPGVWLHDRKTYSDEDIAIGNEKFKQLISLGHTWLKNYLWEVKPTSQTELRRIK
ncbi:MAG: hypothetical protein ACPL4K_06815 [Candidatus Margulisiibacteriota bacterium]